MPPAAARLITSPGLKCGIDAASMIFLMRGRKPESKRTPSEAVREFTNRSKVFDGVLMGEEI